MGWVTVLVSFAQVAGDLADPRLKANAGLPQNDPPGIALAQTLASARAAAPSRGVTWKGLEIQGSDDFGVSPNESIVTGLMRIYPKQACQADAIVIGRPSAVAYHLSGSGTGVYGDYVVAVESVLKDNAAASIGASARDNRLDQGQIVVTRPGGSLTLADGPVDVKLPAFPALQMGVTYLQFLRYVRESSAFQALDPLSTLAAEGNDWKIVRKSLSGVVVPGFVRGELESAIGNWVRDCK
jgi:hypothetical protein